MSRQLNEIVFQSPAAGRPFSSRGIFLQIADKRFESVIVVTHCVHSRQRVSVCRRFLRCFEESGLVSGSHTLLLRALHMGGGREPAAAEESPEDRI